MRGRSRPQNHLMTERSNLSPVDALRALAATQYGGDGDLLDGDHDCTDLYDAGLIRADRDISDEYLISLTPKGADAIRALLADLAPSDDEVSSEPRVTLDENVRNSLIVAIDSSVRRSWPTLREQTENGFAFPDAALTDAIASAVDTWDGHSNRRVSGRDRDDDMDVGGDQRGGRAARGAVLGDDGHRRGAVVMSAWEKEAVARG